MFSSYLPTGKRAQLVPIGQSSFDRWNVVNPLLKKLPRIGSNKGPKPETINGRILTCLGAYGFRQPFNLLEKGVNIAKGHLMQGHDPVEMGKIREKATALVRTDTPQAADELLSTIKIVSLPGWWTKSVDPRRLFCRN